MNVLVPTSDYKVVYKAPFAQEGLAIHAYVYSPPLFTKGPMMVLSEIGDGFYTLMVDFSVEGTYIVVIDGKAEVFRVAHLAKQETSILIRDLLTASVDFNKHTNMLRLYRDSARTQLLAEFLVSDTEAESSKVRQ